MKHPQFGSCHHSPSPTCRHRVGSDCYVGPHFFLSSCSCLAQAINEARRPVLRGCIWSARPFCLNTTCPLPPPVLTCQCSFANDLAQEVKRGLPPAKEISGGGWNAPLSCRYWIQVAWGGSEYKKLLVQSLGLPILISHSLFHNHILPLQFPQEKKNRAIRYDRHHCSDNSCIEIHLLANTNEWKYQKKTTGPFFSLLSSPRLLAACLPQQQIQLQVLFSCSYQ